MDKDIDSIRSELAELMADFVSISFATNSIMITSEDKEFRDWMLWVDPSWRIVKCGKLIMSSMDCPHPDNFEDEDNYSNSFHAWCSRFEGSKKKVKNIQIDPVTRDLTLTCEGGLVIEAFVVLIDDFSWYYTKGDKIYYQIRGDGIVLVDRRKPN